MWSYKLCDRVYEQSLHTYQPCSDAFASALEAAPEQGFECKQFTWDRKETPVEEWIVEMGKGRQLIKHALSSQALLWPRVCNGAGSQCRANASWSSPDTRQLEHLFTNSLQSLVVGRSWEYFVSQNMQVGICMWADQVGFSNQKRQSG